MPPALTRSQAKLKARRAAAHAPSVVIPRRRRASRQQVPHDIFRLIVAAAETSTLSRLMRVSKFANEQAGSSLYSNLPTINVGDLDRIFGARGRSARHARHLAKVQTLSINYSKHHMTSGGQISVQPLPRALSNLWRLVLNLDPKTDCHDRAWLPCAPIIMPLRSRLLSPSFKTLVFSKVAPHHLSQSARPGRQSASGMRIYDVVHKFDMELVYDRLSCLSTALMGSSQDDALVTVIFLPQTRDRASTVSFKTVTPGYVQGVWWLGVSPAGEPLPRIKLRFVGLGGVHHPIYAPVFASTTDLLEVESMTLDEWAQGDDDSGDVLCPETTAHWSALEQADLKSALAAGDVHV